MQAQPYCIGNGFELDPAPAASVLRQPVGISGVFSLEVILPTGCARCVVRLDRLCL